MKSTDIALTYGDEIVSGFFPQKWIDDGHYLPLVIPPKSRPIADPAESADALGNQLHQKMIYIKYLQ